MTARTLGLLIVAVGTGLVLIGLLVWTGGLSWFGRLPGDIRIEREGFRAYIPITSMVLISVLLGVIITVVRRLL